MGIKIFIDTWGWLSLWDQKEKRHKEVATYYKDALIKNEIIYTTDYILDETITLLFKRLPYEKAIDFINIIQEKNGFCMLKKFMMKGLKQAYL